MGLLEILEQAFLPGKRQRGEKIALKEIFCKRKDDDYIKCFKTPVVGAEYKNRDGSDRQATLKKVKVGDKVRLIWDAGEEGKKKKIVVLRGGKASRLQMADCFGRLSDKVAADVIHWLTKDNIVTSARVGKITGGTRKHPKLGCTLELRTYPAPDEK